MAATTDRPIRMARDSSIIFVSAFVGSLLLLVAIPATVLAANPSSGTISETSPSTTWQGQTYILAGTTLPEECPPSEADPLNLVCDHFFLTLDVPPDFWTTHTGGLIIEITWADDANDFDMYIYRVADGQQVDSSAQGGTTSELVFIEAPDPGTYEVRVVPFLIINSGYEGAAQLIASPGGPTPNPVHPTGGIAFATSVIIDPQRTEGEPLNHIDKFGHLWESGPWGVSTTQSFIHKSEDDGDSYHIVSPVGTRPDPPPGGGDTDVVTDDQGFAYFVDLEALVNLGVAVSNDQGNTWRKNDAGVPSTAVDRQWFAMDNGLTPSATDNTVFLTARQIPFGSQVFSSPGSTGVTDPVGGLVYVNAATSTFVSNGAPCGQLKFDPQDRFLYLPCAEGNHVEIARAHVNPGQRTGIPFEIRLTPPSPGGVVGDIFPVLAIDGAGNVYAVWVDESDHNVYLSASQDHGDTWTAPIQVNGDPANSNVFPWAFAGGQEGVVDVVFYGTATRGDSDVFPSWFNSREAATTAKWFPFFAQVHFDFSNPAASTIYQVAATAHPTHYGNICNQGLGCTLSGGDRQMADFFAVTIDGDGAARIVYDDTTNQHHGAALFEARQIAGPTTEGTILSGTPPANPMTDPVGDAEFPHFSPAGSGPNRDSMDFVGLELQQRGIDELRVRMVVADASLLVPPPGAAATIWLTRWNAKALGDGGEESFRIFYVGARSIAGAPPTFFSGTGVSANDAGIMGNGCVTTTPRNCKIVLYPMEKAQSGTLDSATGEIIVDVPLADVGNPSVGDVLFSVTALSFGEIEGAPLFQDVDATRAFDFIISKGAPVGACRVSGGGTIDVDASGGKANFGLIAHCDNRGKVTYIDHVTGLRFRSALITSVTLEGKKATIKGTGFANGEITNFVVVVEDKAEPGKGADTFSITLETGYSRSGVLQGGNIQVR